MYIIQRFSYLQLFNYTSLTLDRASSKAFRRLFLSGHKHVFSIKVLIGLIGPSSHDFSQKL